MSNVNQILDFQEQICYVQCGYCTTILLVSVPCSSLSKMVTVRCGHCTSLLSVNMTKASFVPLHLFSSGNQDDEGKQEVAQDNDGDDDDAGDHQQKNQISSSSAANIQSSLMMNNMSSDEDEEEGGHPVQQIINKPPEKRQRAPSAYNQFIKEEIQRLKAKYPKMTHKQAFSTAAKNWAHFPLSQHRIGGEENSSSHGVMSKIPTKAP